MTITDAIVRQTLSLEARHGEPIRPKVGDSVTVRLAGEDEPRPYRVIYVDPTRMAVEVLPQ